MTRIPAHTIQDAPGASRPVLEALLPASPTGKLLNLHAQMARSPVVLPIPGTGSLAHLEENMGAGSVVLSPGEVAAISAGRG